MEILILCTANRCRSPMAEGLLRHALGGRGIDASVSSAGFLIGGDPATGDAVAVMRMRDIDIEPHRSRVATPELLADADLVIAMARMHVREAGVLEPTVYPRVFTLKELVRRGGEIGPRQGDEPVAAWLERLGEGRDPNALLGDSPDDDVADPVGKSFRTYKKTAKELEALIGQAVELLWP